MIYPELWKSASMKARKENNEALHKIEKSLHKVIGIKILVTKFSLTKKLQSQKN